MTVMNSLWGRYYIRRTNVQVVFKIK